ncbi:MAG: phosphate transport system substrate-binding protein [Pseudohongiellaceae bacterium]|jgi:phosphate transport system substrate-binding protein
MEKVLFTIIILCCFHTSAIANNNEHYLFKIAGSNTVGAHLAPACAVDYLTSKGMANVRIKNTAITNEKIITGINSKGIEQKIFIAAHGSSTGFKALRDSTADLAISSRPIKDKEVDALAHLGDLRSRKSEHTVAIDGLAILVHPSNPVQQLSVQQVAKIFSGQIENWQELGGLDLPIKLYARDNKSGTWDTFKNLVLAKKYRLADKALRFESNDTLSDNVAANPAGIGFTGLASVRQAKLLAISDDNTQPLIPKRLTVATEDYPLSRRLYFYQPQASIVGQNQWLQGYVDHCLSALGQKIVDKVGFVTQNIIAVNQPLYNNAPESYKRLSHKAKRLSVNFRFNIGSSQLDNKAVKDLERVASFLSTPENKNKNVYLVGFTDANKQQRYDLLIARFRALSVHAKLMSKKVSIFKTLSLGSFMPIASSQNSIAKSKNSRVEIWLETEPLLTASR